MYRLFKYKLTLTNYVKNNHRPALARSGDVFARRAVAAAKQIIE
jgi:hypothetical protein